MKNRLLWILLLILVACGGVFISQMVIDRSENSPSTTSEETIEKETSPPQLVSSATAVPKVSKQQAAKANKQEPSPKAAEQKPELAIFQQSYKQTLLENASLLDSDEIIVDGKKVRRSLYQTDFKYPVILVKEILGEHTHADHPSNQAIMVGDHAMMRFPVEMSSADVEQWAKSRGYVVRKKLRSTDVYLIQTADINVGTVDDLLTDFKASFPSYVDNKSTYAEPDNIGFPSATTPNDPLFDYEWSWALNNTEDNVGTPDADIDAPEAWDITTGSRDVMVGVVDSGIDYTHHDLAENIWINPNEIPDNGIDDDGNGYIDDIHGWDFLDDDSDPMDQWYHGTSSASAIGSVGNNNIGVVGVNWEVSLVALRIYNGSGFSDSDTSEAIHYATDIGVDVISLTVSCYASSETIREAIERAGTSNILCVASAGNGGTSAMHYPSGHGYDNILAVGASDRADRYCGWSNYGIPHVDLAAPGDDVLCAYPGNTYALYSGTSCAAPVAAGAAALIKSIAPDISCSELKSLLMDNVDQKPSYSTKCVSGGRLNVRAALESVRGSVVYLESYEISEDTTSNGDGIINPGENVKVALEIRNRGMDPVSGVVATISFPSPDSRFNVITGTINIGNLNPGETVTPTATFVVVSDPTTPTPHTEQAEVELSYLSLGDYKTRTATIPLSVYTSLNVSGQVTTLLGASVPYAKVHYEGPMSGEVSSDTLGNYSALLIDGTYSVHASHPFYADSIEQIITVPPEQSGINFEIGNPEISIEPNPLRILFDELDPVSAKLNIENNGDFPLQWELQNAPSGDNFWIKTAPESGTVAPGEIQDVELSIYIARGHHNQGIHTDRVSIVSNDPIQPEIRYMVITDINHYYPNVVIDLPEELSETDGYLPNAGTVSLTTPASSNVTVELFSFSPKLTVPPSVVIPSGSTNATFDMTLLDDDINGGPVDASVIGSAEAFVSGIGNVLIHDNDTPRLSIDLSAEATEGDGILTNAGMVSTSLTLTEDVDISLTSIDETEIIAPAFVTIPAGQSNALFDVVVVDDTSTDGLQTASIECSAADMIMVDGSGSMNIIDNDFHHFEFGVLATQVVASTPFPYTIQTKTIDGYPASGFSGTAKLSATGDSGNHVAWPYTLTFTNGYNSGTSWLKFMDTGVSLVADGGNGLTGTSTVFDVVSSSMFVMPTELATVFIPANSSYTRQIIITNGGTHALTFDALLMSDQNVMYSTNTGPIAYYPFNGNANDESGNGHDGTVSNAMLTVDRFGNTNSAFQFTGVQDCNITIPDSEDLRLEDTSFTISFWIKPDHIENEYMTIPILDKGWTIGANSWDSIPNRYHLNLYNGIHVSEQLWLNTWEHVVSVYDATENRAGLYLGHQPTAYSYAPLSLQQLPPENGDGIQLNVGKNFSGIIDDIRIYHRALESEEVLELYTEDVTNDGSVSLSAFNGTVDPGDFIILEVSFDSTGMVAGEEAAEVIKIISNDSSSPTISIPVSMKVVP